jgi:hypothetical protein
MNKDEHKRLEALQKDATKCAGNFVLEKLTVPDLLLLLHKDENLRKLIRAIAAEAPETDDFDTSGDEEYDTACDEDDRGSPPAQLPIMRTEPPVTRFAPAPTLDPLRQQVAPELALLQAVRADAEIAAAWLGEPGEDEGRQLLRLAVCSAQWDLLSELWEKLAGRCKQAQRGASATELEILRGALALHNLRWRGREAKLEEVATGATYDYERHQRGTPSGDSVRGLWLPGLFNAGGQLHKKPLVQT